MGRWTGPAAGLAGAAGLALAGGALSAATTSTDAVVERQSAEAPVRPAVDWLEKPSGDDLAYVYPERAVDERMSGRAVIGCVVLPNGSLAGCEVLSEDPPGWGFGEAAVKVSRRFRMRVDPEAPPLPRIRIPIRFNMAASTERSGVGRPLENLIVPARIALGVMAAMIAALVAFLVLRRRQRDRDEDSGDIVT